MAKGQVKVEVFSERLRLRWSYRGQLDVANGVVEGSVPAA
jgi:hypothetical protein